MSRAHYTGNPALAQQVSLSSFNGGALNGEVRVSGSLRKGFTGAFTPLMQAAAMGHVERLLELIEEGADVNARGPRDSTALMFAAGAGHVDIVKILVEHGADLDAREAGGWTALCHAREDGETEIIDFLESYRS